MHVCLCTWKFYHLMCVLVSVVPDLREGLMSTCFSNVGLLLIMSQNNLSKKLPPFFQRPVLFPERYECACMCASLWVCERMLSVALSGSAASQPQQQKCSEAGLHKVI